MRFAPVKIFLAILFGCLVVLSGGLESGRADDEPSPSVSAPLTVAGEAGGGVSSLFPAEEIGRAKQYQKKRLAVTVNRILLDIVFLSFILFSGAALFFEGLSGRLARGRYFRKLLLFASAIVLLYWIVSFPLDLQRFRLERIYGLTPLTLEGWGWIVLKSRGITLPLFLFTIAVVYRFILWHQRAWWIPAGAAVSALMLVLTVAAPVVIYPFFGSFQPLDDPGLESRLVGMLEKSGLERPEILVVDSHRRTARANAYFTGLGNTERVILFDTLVNEFPTAEVESVLAHELGHYRKHHTFWGWLLAAAGVFALFYAVSRVLSRARRIPRLGITNEWDVAGIPLFLLLVVIVLTLTLPLRNLVSRSFERAADRFALALTGNPEAFISTQQRLVLRNLSDPRPHPLVEFIFYSHPPAEERINMARERIPPEKIDEQPPT